MTWHRRDGEGLGFDELVRQMEDEFSAVTHEYYAGDMHAFGAGLRMACNVTQ